MMRIFLSFCCSNLVRGVGIASCGVYIAFSLQRGLYANNLRCPPDLKDNEFTSGMFRFWFWLRERVYRKKSPPFSNLTVDAECLAPKATTKRSLNQEISGNDTLKGSCAR